MKLLEYIQGNRRGTEAHHIERSAMEDPFLYEAIEGFDAIGGEHDLPIERLRRFVDKRTSSRNKRRLGWTAGAVAATVLLCFIFGNRFLAWVQQGPNISYLTENKSIKQSTPKVSEAETFLLPDSVAEFSPDMTELDMENPFGQEVTRTTQRVTETLERAVPGESKNRQTSIFSDMEEIDELALSLPNADLSVHAPVTTQFQRSDKSLSDNNIQTRNAPTSSVAGIPLSSSALPDDSSAKAIDKVTTAGYGSQRQEVVGSASVDTDPTIRLRRVVPDGVPAGGMESFRRYVRENLSPQYDSAGQKLAGSVTLEFAVNNQGVPVDIRVTQGLAPQANAEALRLLKEAPAWQPSQQRVQIKIEF